jgi:regulator of ribosome biosynthesis
LQTEALNLLSIGSHVGFFWSIRLIDGSLPNPGSCIRIKRLSQAIPNWQRRVNMSAIRRAQDVVPGAYEDNASDESSEGSDAGLAEDIVDDLTYDVRNLIAANYSGLLIPSNDREREEFLKHQAQRAAQLMINRVFSLPIENTQTDILAILPANEEFSIPRAQRLPEAKIETKWEKFAREKGIKKKKKDKMVFDEHDETYKPRFGYKRTNNGILDVPVLEVKKGADPYADPWEEALQEKKLRVAKNTKQQLKNAERAAIIKGKKTKQSERPSSMGEGGAAPGIPILGGANRKRGRDGVMQALQLAQHSTASMGRYDETLKGEPALKLKGRKRAFADNLGDAADDHHRMKQNIRIVEDKVDKKARGVTNSLKAYEGIIPDAPSDTFKQKKGKGKNLNKAKKSK